MIPTVRWAAPWRPDQPLSLGIGSPPAAATLRARLGKGLGLVHLTLLRASRYAVSSWSANPPSPTRQSHSPAPFASPTRCCPRFGARALRRSNATHPCLG